MQKPAGLRNRERSERTKESKEPTSAASGRRAASGDGRRGGRDGDPEGERRGGRRARATIAHYIPTGQVCATETLSKASIIKMKQVTHPLP